MSLIGRTRGQVACLVLQLWLVARILARRARTVRWHSVVAFGLVACVPAMAGSAMPKIVIPHTSVQLETLIFAPEQRIVQAVSAGTFDICRDDAMAPDFSVASIRIWTGPLFRTAIRPPRGRCPFAVYSKQRYSPQPGDIKTEDCIARPRTHGAQVTSITMFVMEETKRHYFQCEYRLSMAFIGFQGALHLPENLLFVPSHDPMEKYGYPIGRAFSEIMPEPFIRLQRACQAPISWFYKPIPGQTRSQVNSAILATPCRLK
jgi:hypothetical protein